MVYTLAKKSSRVTLKSQANSKTNSGEAFFLDAEAHGLSPLPPWSRKTSLIDQAVFPAEPRCALLILLSVALQAASISHVELVLTMKSLCHPWMRVCFYGGPFMSKTLCWRGSAENPFFWECISLVRKIIAAPGRTISKMQIKVPVIKGTTMITIGLEEFLLALILSEIRQSVGLLSQLR